MTTSTGAQRRSSWNACDLVGQVFGRLTVIAKTDIRGGGNGRMVAWLCRCECGKERLAYTSYLRAGDVKSCGCMPHGFAGRFAPGSHPRLVHGLSHTREYSSWNSMMNRCLNPNDQAYARYGGRGITVCDRWRTFQGFLADMGKRPEGTTIDRIDNDLGYFKENCRWATLDEQNANRPRLNIPVLEHGGVSLSIAQWAQRVGISPHTLKSRLRFGWSVERALSTPTQRRSK